MHNCSFPLLSLPSARLLCVHLYVCACVHLCLHAWGLIFSVFTYDANPCDELWPFLAWNSSPTFTVRMKRGVNTLNLVTSHLRERPSLIDPAEGDFKENDAKGDSHSRDTHWISTPIIDLTIDVIVEKFIY